MLLKNVTKVLVYLFISLLFTTNAFSFDIDKDIKISNEQRESIRKKCIDSKNDKFKDISNVPLKLLSTYYNSILDFILEKNKTILSLYEKTASDFCIYVTEGNDEVKTFESKGNGLIQLGIGYSYLISQFSLLDNDADVAVTTAHEIAHNILDHKSKEQTLRKIIYKEFLTQQLNISFNAYLNQHPKYIKFRQEAEVEADNLGLKLYINSGLKVINYRDFFTKAVQLNTLKHKPIDISNDKWDLFIKTSKNCIALGANILNEKKSNGLSIVDAVKSETFNSFLDKIQYLRPKDFHPTGCWRYWNIYKEEVLHTSDLKKDYKNDLVSILYLKLDLNSFIYLSSIKNINSIKNTNVNSEFDPRVMTIMSLCNPDAKINYSLQISSTNRKDTGTFNSTNNSLVLRYFDIAQIILTLNVLVNIHTVIQLGISPQEATGSITLKLFSEIKKAFL